MDEIVRVYHQEDEARVERIILVDIVDGNVQIEELVHDDTHEEVLRDTVIEIPRSFWHLLVESVARGAVPRFPSSNPVRSVRDKRHGSD